jgi:hypothetical protein
MRLLSLSILILALSAQVFSIRSKLLADDVQATLDAPVVPQDATADVPPVSSDIQPVSSDIQPVSSDIQPAADAQPAASDIQPAASDIQPAADVQPAASDAQPAASDAQPAASDAQPAASDIEPAAPVAKKAKTMKLYQGPIIPPGYTPEQFTHIPEQYWFDADGNGGLGFFVFESYSFNHIGCKDGAVAFTYGIDFDKSFLFKPEFLADGKVAFKADSGYLGSADGIAFTCSDQEVGDSNKFSISFVADNAHSSPDFMVISNDKFGYLGEDMTDENNPKLKFDQKLYNDFSQAWYGAEFEDRDSYDQLAYHYASKTVAEVTPAADEGDSESDDSNDIADNKDNIKEDSQQADDEGEDDLTETDS